MKLNSSCFCNAVDIAEIIYAYKFRMESLISWFHRPGRLVELALDNHNKIQAVHDLGN
jgi:hypothetical protein